MATVNRLSFGTRRTNRTGRHWIAAWHRVSGTDTFQRIDIDSGAILETRPVYTFQSGQTSAVVSPPSPGATVEQITEDIQFFGASESCPVTAMPDPPAVSESVECPCPPCECPQDGNEPGSTGNATDPELPPDDPLAAPYWTAACTGGGLVPFQADPTDSESWVS